MGKTGRIGEVTDLPGYQPLNGSVSWASNSQVADCDRSPVDSGGWSPPGVRNHPLRIRLLDRPDGRSLWDGRKLRCKRLQPGLVRGASVRRAARMSGCREVSKEREKPGRQRDGPADDALVQAGLSWRHRRPPLSQPTTQAVGRGRRLCARGRLELARRTQPQPWTQLRIRLLARPDDRTAQDGPKVRCKRLRAGIVGHPG